MNVKRTKNSVLNDIKVYSELALYFEMKMGHTDDWVYSQRQMILNERNRDRCEEEARRMGISESDIEEAKNKGRDFALEIAEECETLGWE